MKPKHINEPSKVILVGVDFGDKASFDSTLDELASLSQSSGDDPVARLIAKRVSPDPAFFVGSGKANEIKGLVEQYQAHAVVFDQFLSPIQQRNLERLLGVEVLDRTMLILEIFAKRAQSHEGKLQVELARLQYLSTRLVHRWSHLERQRGGVGLRGGPGETQIELDRRMLAQRIKALKLRLNKLARQRHTRFRARMRNETFRIALVGYTNAGKSTLFNTLTKASSYAADQLFATLDTTVRQLYLNDDIVGSITVADTVGFIRDLPHTLVEAFQATLQEAADANCLLHIVDASNPQHNEQIQEVLKVLRDIGGSQIPQIAVYSKVDLCLPHAQPHQLVDTMELEHGRYIPRVFVSAATGQGIPELKNLLSEKAELHFANSLSSYDFLCADDSSSSSLSV